MKRIVGTFVLLVGLSGCITFGPPQGDKRPSDATPTPTTLAQASYPAMPPDPAPPVWDVDPGRGRSGTYAEYKVPPPPAPVGRLASGMTLAPSTPASATPAAATPASPLAPVTPPAPVANPGPQPAQLPALSSTANTPPAAPANPLPVMAGMPVVITPHAEQSPNTTQQVGFTQEDSRQPPGINTRTELHAGGMSKPSLPLTPTPTLVGQQVHEPKIVRAGAPLMRLVNTKRITLNFEVKDVGSSGLGSVELWSTQDCRTWQKHKAPTTAKAYVVEVDDEGMYGFTLLAHSGVGLSKEPPAPGDQPQVWVVVDLTKPEVQLTEVTPIANDRTQQVSIKWKASDKNLNHQPITLSYAERKEGPWRVIASNLENTGYYSWQVPADAPSRFLVRCEALDLAGNIGRAQTDNPVPLDTRVPSVVISNVEANCNNR